MSYVLLVRGYAHNDVLVWLFILALLVILLGGRWLANRLMFWVQHRRVHHLWPFS